MVAIGVRELKAHLSQYLKRVQAGERLTVTDRGRAIVMLSPAETTTNLDWLHAMVADGAARWGGGKPRGLKNPPSSTGRLASQIVIEDRR
jgi:prevent-host-death family protein